MSNTYAVLNVRAVSAFCSSKNQSQARTAHRHWGGDHLAMNVVKELMGHTKAETTLEYYNQVDSDDEKRAARIVQKLMENAQESKKTDVKLTCKGVSRQNGDNE
jgi:limonene-1,2-epoxide hydrolase